MSMDGKGFWKKWDDASFFGAPFIWTTLHDFGGNVGIKGNVSQINQVRADGSSLKNPFQQRQQKIIIFFVAAVILSRFDALTHFSTGYFFFAIYVKIFFAFLNPFWGIWCVESVTVVVVPNSHSQVPFTDRPTSVIGTGYTPEGIDQNPAYYELMNQVCLHSLTCTYREMNPAPDPYSPAISILWTIFHMLLKTQAIFFRLFTQELTTLHCVLTSCIFAPTVELSVTAIRQGH